MPPTSVHFNGSVNMPDGETVMREISTRIPDGVRRMTDGETGDRGYWISFQQARFVEMPEFETVHSGLAYETSDDAPEMVRLKLTDGVSADAIDWPDLGYAGAYAESFELFRRLQEEGVIPAGTRLQLQYPTPIASTAIMIEPEDLAAVTEVYEEALLSDLDALMARVPHDACAVQWDVAVEFGLLEGTYGPAMPVDQVAPGVIRCVDRVPDDVPVGLHLCYGDYGHQHFKDPESLAMQVALLNAVAAGARRPVDFVSFTVPQARDDDAYFAPLGDLETGPETELCFALVPYHPDDQAPGTTERQIAAVDGALAGSAGGSREWGVCTECGMGRAAAADVPRLLDLHAEIVGQRP